MTKKEFKSIFVKELQDLGHELDEKRIKSALDKTIRGMRNKYGSADWDNEWAESETQNAHCYYSEYKVQNTFNREVALNARRQG